MDEVQDHGPVLPGEPHPTPPLEDRVKELESEVVRLNEDSKVHDEDLRALQAQTEGLDGARERLEKKVADLEDLLHALRFHLDARYGTPS